MKILKLKSFFFSLMAIAMVTVFLTSCEKNTLKEEDLQIESNSNTSYQYDEGLQASLNDPTPIVLSDYYGDFTKTEIEMFIKSATEIDIYNYKKNYVIAEFLLKKKIINESNYKEWVNQALYKIDLNEYLNEEEIISLREEIDKKIQSDNKVNKKINCSWNSYTVGYICHPFFGICWPITVSDYTCISNTIVLYEGNNITQRIVGTIDADMNRFVNIKSNSCCPNDEARSMEMFNMEAGQIVTVFDRSDGGTSEESCRIEILQSGIIIREPLLKLFIFVHLF